MKTLNAKPIGHSQTISWPKGPVKWVKDRTLFVSIPFTWNLPELKSEFEAGALFWDEIVIGGPGAYLLLNYFSHMNHVRIGFPHSPGILQRVNPLATKTTSGCIRNCKFCAVRRIEGHFQELENWPDLPIICDNNLLACSIEHFDRVIDRLKGHIGVDFNQGLDCRLLTDYHAKRIAEIKGIAKRGLRLALDNMTYARPWAEAIERLLSAGIAKRKISSYALIGFDSGPDEAWERCQYIESLGVRVLPMWFHELDALEKNQTTDKQQALGWTEEDRKKIMQWFYHYRILGRGKNESAINKTPMALANP